MSPQVVLSVHAPVEITKPHKIGFWYAVLETGVCFEVFNGMKGQNNPKKNSNTKYRSEPQYIFWDVFT